MLWAQSTAKDYTQDGRNIGSQCTNLIQSLRNCKSRLSADCCIKNRLPEGDLNTILHRHIKKQGNSEVSQHKCWQPLFNQVILHSMYWVYQAFFLCFPTSDKAFIFIIFSKPIAWLGHSFSECSLFYSPAWFQFTQKCPCCHFNFRFAFFFREEKDEERNWHYEILLLILLMIWYFSFCTV